MAIEITIETNIYSVEYVRIKDTVSKIDKAIPREDLFVNRQDGLYGGTEFILYWEGSNILGKNFQRSEVSIPASIDDDDLFDKLVDICMSNISISGTVDVNVVNTPSVNATIVAPLPLPVTGTVNANATIVSPLPLPVSLISPLPVPITGTVTATISGNVLVTKEVGTLHKYTALTATPQNVFIGAGNVYGAVGINPNSQLKFLKLYDTLAAPTVGTTPVKLVISLERDKLSNVIEFARGISFTNGCWAACTNDYDDASSTLSPKGIYINIIT